MYVVQGYWVFFPVFFSVLWVWYRVGGEGFIVFVHDQPVIVVGIILLFACMVFNDSILGEKEIEKKVLDWTDKESSNNTFPLCPFLNAISQTLLSFINFLLNPSHFSHHLDLLNLFVLCESFVYSFREKLVCLRLHRIVVSYLLSSLP
ncbi:hypothetical protein RJT34_33465 [Clitoria ternatea]|uniref:Uncharacterized protein n=1 Tax=Clitoria ternatea TaxID=43366 RepID=A0AAN9IAG5_CLITE